MKYTGRTPTSFASSYLGGCCFMLGIAAVIALTFYLV